MASAGYVLAVRSARLGPAQWARLAVTAYHEFRADRIVAERSFGGAMVENVITTAGPNVPVKTITASRGKAVRAEPIAALYAQGKVCHVGRFPQLEEQMLNMASAGYVGAKSPDRLDALVWALSELMLGPLVRQRAASAVNAIEAAHRRPAPDRHNRAASALERHREVGSSIPLGSTTHSSTKPVIPPVASMGSAAFSAQYQQQPVPAGGNLIKWRWFAAYDNLPPKRFDHRIVQSWDTASKAEELSDYSVGITALVTRDEIYILQVIRERLEYPALKRRIVEEKRRWKAGVVLIEDKGSGISLNQDLKREGVYSIAIKTEGDKVVRMSASSDRIESGSVFLPREARWLDDFRTELLAFPYGSHDDQVDALSQLINWTKTRGISMVDYL